MKLTQSAFLAALLLTVGSYRLLALAGDLDHPSLSFPSATDPGLRERIMQVLGERPAEFRGGRFVNAHTRLRYAGDASSLNRFLAGLAACPGLQLRIAFRTEAGEVAWTLEHDAWTAPRGFSILINAGCKTLDLEKVVIPAIRTSGFVPDSVEDARTPPSERSRAATEGKHSFGPVIERVVPFGVPCRAKYFRFRTGEVFEIGDGPGDTSDHAAEWRRIDAGGGVDALSIGGKEGVQFAGEGCVFTRERSPEWGTLKAEDVVRRLRRATWITGVIEAKSQELPMTFLFRTASGDRGILELRAIAPEPRGESGLGLSIRYQLVQSALE